MRVCACARIRHPVIISVELLATVTEPFHGFPQHPQTKARLEKRQDKLLSNPNPSVIHHLPSSLHAAVGSLQKGRPENRESILSRA